MNKKMIGILLSILAVYIGLNGYIGWNAHVFLSTAFRADPGMGYWIAFWLVAFSYLIARAGAAVMSDVWMSPLKWIGSIWFAVMLYSAILLPVADLVGRMLKISSFPPDVYITTVGCTVLAILLVLFSIGSWNAWRPVIRKYEVQVAKPAGAFRQLRVAVASDLHLGTIVGRKHLKRMVERINALNPDLVLLPGDVIDDDIRPFIRRRMADVLQQLRAKNGVYAILGNHEYIGGDIEPFVEAMQGVGIRMLLDETVKIDNALYLVGRKDRSAERFGGGGRLPLERLMEEVDTRFPVILMDHQPYELDKAAAAGIDVLLSGHTHRGQMAPSHWVTRKLFELDWGYLKKGNLHAIVSSGYGTWGPPFRLGSQSEIIELTIDFEA